MTKRGASRSALFAALASLLVALAGDARAENPCGLDGEIIAGLGDGIGGTGLSTESDGIGGTGLSGESDGIGGTGLSSQSDGIGGTGLSSQSDGIGGTGLSGESDGIGGTGIYGTITRFGSICVNGLRVHFAADAEVDVGGESRDTTALAIGHVVWVEAQSRDGRLETDRIELATAASGVVQDLDLEKQQFWVGDHLIEANEEIPVFEGHGLALLAEGDRVRVSGLPAAGDRIMASRIDRDQGLPAAEFAVSDRIFAAEGLEQLSIEAYSSQSDNETDARFSAHGVELNTSKLAPALTGIGPGTRVWLSGRLSPQRVLHVDRVSVRARGPRGGISRSNRGTRAGNEDEATGGNKLGRGRAASARKFRRAEVEERREIASDLAARRTETELRGLTPAELRELLRDPTISAQRRDLLRKLFESGAGGSASASAIGNDVAERPAPPADAAQRPRQRNTTVRQTNKILNNTARRAHAAARPRPERVDRTQRPERPEHVDRTQRPERPERVDRPQRPERPERVDRPQRPERPEHVDRTQRPERPERVDRTQRPERPEHVDRTQRPERPQP